MLVSVVVPVRDDERGVRAVVAALERQTLAPHLFEIVVAVDGGRIPSVPAGVRLVAGPPRNSYAARNRGAAAALGRVLAFTDADCLPRPDWLEQGVAALNGADVVAGAVHFAVPSRPGLWALLDLERHLDQERQVARGRAATANLLMRRDVFDAIGGFDESLPSGGDHAAVQRAVRAGAVIRYAPKARVDHPARDGARAMLRRLWFTDFNGSARAARDHEPKEPHGKWLLVPFASGVADRAREGRPPHRLDARRLEHNGAHAGRLRQAAALALLYGVASPVSSAARLAGGLHGVRLRRAALDERPPRWDACAREFALARKEFSHGVLHEPDAGPGRRASHGGDAGAPRVGA
jgi:hypothetical protein